MTNKEQFAKVYRLKLYQAVFAEPTAYAYDLNSVEEVAGRMLAALEKGTASKNSRAIRATCKELGIKHTYKDIFRYLNS